MANNEIEKPKQYSNFIEFGKSQSCEPIVKSNCKLCNSIYRQEVEDMFLDGKSSFSVYKWLRAKNEDISSKAVHNHFIQHYQKPVLAERIKDYASNLEEYQKIQVNDEEQMNLYSTLLDQQIHVLASSISKTNPEEMRKGQETLIKLVDQAVKLKERAKAMRQDNEPIKILIQHLNNVMAAKYSEAKTAESRQIMGEFIEIIVKETESLSNVSK